MNQGILFGSIFGLPSVTTGTTTLVEAETFTANGEVTDTGAGGVTVSRGFYIGTDSTYSNNTKHTIAGTQSIGTFSYNATGLTSSTTYYVTSFAIGYKGESIGTTVSVSTATGTVQVYNAGDTSGWTYDQCFCGSANGSGTLGASYMEIYAPWWGGGGYTTNTTIALTGTSYVEVDYTTTNGIQGYMSFSVTTGHNGSNPTSTQLITGGSGPQVAYASGAQIPVNFPQDSTVALSLGNAASSRVRITRVEYF